MINKQRHKKSCGPVAILNAMRRKGSKISYKDMIKKCQKNGAFNLKKGMALESLCHMIKYFGLTYSLDFNPRLKRIKNYLNQGKYIILMYKVHDDLWHFAFIDNCEKNSFTIWNGADDRPTITGQQMNGFIKRSKNAGPGAWVVIIH